MSDQQTMNARILDELVNERITSEQVDKAIISTIRNYRRKRFFFNQILDTLAATDGNEWYTAATTITDLGGLKKLLWANISVNSIKSPMKIRTVEWMEARQSGTYKSIPRAIAYGRQRIRLYPIPNDSYTIEFFAHYELPEPTVGGNSTVAWFTHGEELIRNGAEKRLCFSVLQAPDMAAIFEPLELDALDALVEETTQHEPDEHLRPEPMGLGSRYGYDINID